MSEDRKKQFELEVEKDEELRKVKEFSLNGWPICKGKMDKELKKYWMIRNEITVYDGVLFYNDRFIVPKRLRQEMLKLMHEPHMGIEKTKKRGRKIMYWHGMSLDIERWVTNCLVCQKYATSKPKEPLLVHDYPELPWEKIGVDIMEWKGRSRYYGMERR
ncbi:Integrase zinc binding domain [Popillia japonica]|uniref:RNA-directed DNA polymerase n=1 Tax=Popillia japonica TaxID=7064 RepID=A0AAW1IBE1_POPJA